MPDYVPQWPGAFEDYARVYVYRNAWRVKYCMDVDDCMGVAGMVFAKLLTRYETKKFNSPKQLMALYKVALANEFYDINLKATRERDAVTEYGSLYRNSTDYSQGPLTSRLSEASQELRDVIRIVAGAPAELLNLLLLEADDCSWSRRLCRLCRLPVVSETIISELRELLSGESA